MLGIEYKNKLKNDKRGHWSKENSVKKHFLDDYNYIINFAKENKLNFLPFKEIVWYTYNNINSIVMCNNCGVNKPKFKGFQIGYTKYCCRKCADTSDDKKNNYKKTCIDKYGVENSFQDKNVKDKIKETNLERYGVENVSQLQDIQNKKKETNIERYGVEHPSQTKEFQDKIKETNLERYGVEHVLQSEQIKDKIKETNIKRYNVEFPTQSKDIRKKIIESNIKNYGVKNVSQSHEIKDKIKETNLERYGVEHVSQTKEFQDKIKQTCLNKYGVEHVSQTKEFQDKIKETCLNKYGVEHQSQSKERQEYYKNKFKDKYKDDKNVIDVNYKTKEITYKCDKCNDIHIIPRYFYYNRSKFYSNICLTCNPINNTSNLELAIQDLLTELGVEFITNTRDIISPKELDIYIPEYNIAIECNGVYWHSELYRPNNYHQEKYLQCKDKGIKLIQIWEDDWYIKNDIIKSRLENLFNSSKRIYARKCVIKEIDNKNSKEFLENNHIQGNVNAKYKIGLYYNDELVSLLTMGSLRKMMNQKNIENNYEILRFCNKINYTVIGGFSKLLKYFIKNNNIENIITYADSDWSDGNLYSVNGFEFVSQTKPGYYYSNNYIRQHRYNFTKQKLVNQGFDKNKTEHEIMLERGYYRCYNSGSSKWNLNIK